MKQQTSLAPVPDLNMPLVGESTFTLTGAWFNTLPSVPELLGYAAAGVAVEQAAIWYHIDLVSILLESHNLSVDEILDVLPDSFPWRSRGAILNRAYLARQYPAFQTGDGKFLTAAEAIGRDDIHPVMVDILGKSALLRCIRYERNGSARTVPISAYADAASLKTLPKRVHALAWFVENDATIQEFRAMLHGNDQEGYVNGEVITWGLLQGHVETLTSSLARVPEDLRPSIEVVLNIAQGKVRVVR